MPTIDEYKKKGGWYEFPNGEKRQGEEAAQEYLDSVDVDGLFEEPEPEDEVITTEDLDVTEEAVEEVQEPAPEPTVEEDSKEFLVRRRNPGVKYAVKGPSGRRYVFTRQHPLVVVKAEDVEFFVSQSEFELATPAQAQEFYS